MKPGTATSSKNTSTSAPTYSTQGQGQSTQKKRKRSPPPSAVSQKKIKTIIDCEKAIAFFLELGLSRSFLNCGQVLAWNLKQDDPDYLRILTYVSNGKHPLLDCQVLQVLRVMAHADSLQDDETPSDFNDDPTTKGQLRKMLWHGTSRKNVHKILQNGLKLPKKMLQYFGHGIYFSDWFAMSVLYCKDWRNGYSAWEEDKDGTNIGYLFLSDVLLGNVHKTYNFLPDAPKIKVSKPGGWFWETEIKKVDSIQGCGWRKMDPQGDTQVNGCVWPLGRNIRDKERPYFANPIIDGDEFVVYETRRVIPNFLVKVKINVPWYWYLI